MPTIEFTIEPFAEGNPGPHVTSATEAASKHADHIEIGPFGTTLHLPSGAVGETVAALVETALANGATHISLHVAADETNESR